MDKEQQQNYLQNHQQGSNQMNQQQQAAQGQMTGGMWLLTKEDWVLIRPDKSKKQSIEDVKQANSVAKFIKMFAEEFEYYFSDMLKLGTQTNIKAQVFYHRIKALKRNQQLDDNLYAITCLFLAAKLDDTLFKSEMCVEFYIALQQYLKVDATFKPHAFKALVSISKLDERAKSLRKQTLKQIIEQIPKHKIQQEKGKLLFAENDILVSFGYDFVVDTALPYVDQFVKSYKEFINKQKELQEQRKQKEEAKQEGEMKQEIQQDDKTDTIEKLLNTVQFWGNDVYRSNLCLYYTPIQLTLTVLKKAQQTERVVFPDYNGQPWWKFFNEKYNANIQSEDDFKEPLMYFNNIIAMLKS
ncbi:amine-terminal domain cyclin (macronuclear) [Tetrahymena thermophila SB210]|uniref:Amine-terminal domain cyclin n=1 Tax=Tetrahymena thermophila (strain SB210) TaxID=312017 RepID=W7XHG2_TETTS|nr:amine-terminal domain cyclin [Tetrahymena thermophila SB210]EWS76693.1 amine-terminal domain cyclin [Tetrahymena thermophila SB210]|eukprot:XP_012650763.1 amine-terminal domain cyclin [Tetrahymena thermophila SB210]